jgi:hypothetical protein
MRFALPRRRAARRAPRAALLALALLAASPAHAADDEVRTAHIVARGDIGRERLEGYAVLAEACWPAWVERFKETPPKDRLPLRMDVRADRDGWLRALASAGVSGAGALQGAGGYYDPRTRVSYLYLQPHDSSTRLLVLHELTHQFQYKAVLGDRPERSPLWHREGIAEHFGYHRRTKQGLEIGAYDMVAIDARPAEVVDRIAKGTFDPWAVGTGKVVSPDYTDALALAGTLLRTRDAALTRAFARYEDDLLRGIDPGQAFERAFTPVRTRLKDAVTEVWGGLRRPWQLTYVAWDETPGAIVGDGRPWAFLRGTETLRASDAGIEATVTLGSRTAAGGVCLGVKGPDDLVALEVRSDGRVRVRVKRRGVWTDVGGVTLPSNPVERPVKLRMAVGGPVLRLEIAGMPAPDVPFAAAGLTPSDLDGSAGLMAESGEVRFESVDIRGR